MKKNVKTTPKRLVIQCLTMLFLCSLHLCYSGSDTIYSELNKQINKKLHLPVVLYP